ncbi:ATP-binding protein [Candidatus Micrarchaeota archaeon]|nr:ATP-binding protein [Candidatus Micrarchaeota archaeon]
MDNDFSVETTKEIAIPKDPLGQVIGQEQAVRIAKIAARQRRHLLLVGPPGIGKSMIAQSIAYHLQPPTQEISVLHNPGNPERPLVEVRDVKDIAKEKNLEKSIQGKFVDGQQIPAFVAEKLGFRCRKCGRAGKATEDSCSHCGAEKYRQEYSPFGDLLFDRSPAPQHPQRVHTTRMNEDGREEVIVYERMGERVRILDQRALERMDALKQRKPRKVIIPLERNNFIIATGASETELLGDVRHDPYGGHHQIGVHPYARVVAGAIHEAHEGVLFVDELSTMNYLQRFLFTAMQERKYAIVGRNPQSSGASVKVPDVPCEFMMIAASNINDLQYILPPLRSRIVGSGYEVLLDTYMPDTKENRASLLQFIAQEIRKDGKIPHASIEAAERIIEEARLKALHNDDATNSLTLRFRDLSGIVRLAGDIAVVEDAEKIEKPFVETAIERMKSIEEQLKDKYGSIWKAGASEFAKPDKRDLTEVR